MKNSLTESAPEVLSCVQDRNNGAVNITNGTEPAQRSPSVRLGDPQTVVADPNSARTEPRTVIANTVTGRWWVSDQNHSRSRFDAALSASPPSEPSDRKETSTSTGRR